jgi:DNA helicase-2/ATP-dependent DNA helicase PcrA
VAEFDLLASLNDQQIAAITAPPGPTLVIAGPGSGKTAVLTRRVAYLIKERGVPPWRILAVTFTNKAAQEMKDRIDKMLEGQTKGLNSGTFHAICARILRREAAFVGLKPDYVIYDTDDQVAAMKRAIEMAKLDPKQYPPRGQLAKISNAKNELIGPEEYPASRYVDQITKELYSHYQEILGLCNAVDFDDLLMKTVLLFKHEPDVLTRYQGYYEHLLVDEFQDTNTAQYALLKMLAGTQCDLFCVGDPDQSIYKFRGADYRNITRFQKDYPQARTILLEQNYRSHQLILDAAMAIINKNPDRIRKELTTTRQTGPKIVLRDVINEEEEGQYVVEKILDLTYSGKYKLKECAVMYRTNAQSRAIEAAFVMHGVPYRVVGATKFYSRREIRDLLAYLKLVHNPDDDFSLERIINIPPRGIGTKTINELTAYAQKRHQSMLGAILALRNAADSPFSVRAQNSLLDFAEMIDKWNQDKDTLSVGPLLDAILMRSGYGAFLNDGTPEGEDRASNVRELSSLAYSYDNGTLNDFLTEVSLVADADTQTDASNATVLLTLHAAKGLEFPVVFIVGMEEGILPHQRALDDPEEMDEERRLMYVGVTRAKDQLYLSWAFQRTIFGQGQRSTASRFLAEIPANVTTGSPLPRQVINNYERDSYRRATTWTPPVPTPRAQPTARTQPVERVERTSKFHSGQRVRHAMLGEGVVIASKVRGDDEEVDVKFEKHTGIKRLSAAIANLVTVSE